MKKIEVLGLQSVPEIKHGDTFILAKNKQIKSELHGQGKRKILLPKCEVSTNSM